MILLDTDVLIDLVDQREPTFSFLRRLQAEGGLLATTSLNAAELLRGTPPRTKAAQRVGRALMALQEVPFGPKAARRYGELMHALDRAGSTVPVVDGLIAAVALEAGGRLVTRNERHFRRMAGLEVVKPGK